MAGRFCVSQSGQIKTDFPRLNLIMNLNSIGFLQTEQIRLMFFFASSASI